MGCYLNITFVFGIRITLCELTYIDRRKIIFPAVLRNTYSSNIQHSDTVFSPGYYDSQMNTSVNKVETDIIYVYICRLEGKTSPKHARQTVLCNICRANVYNTIA